VDNVFSHLLKEVKVFLKAKKNYYTDILNIIDLLVFIFTFLEFASLIGLLLYSIWSRLWLSIKALVV
jgi:membrane protein insertase Oxa1/YidC/SpoIIIJ